MNIVFARVSLSFCVGLAANALADSNAPSDDPRCVRATCFAPSCYRQYGHYYLQCPDGNHHLPTPPPPTETDPQTDRPAPPHSSDPAAIQAIGGDWEFRLGASPKPLAVLRLRPNSTGSMQGSLEQSLGSRTTRVNLQDVAINGTTISYVTPGGRQYQGTLSSDHRTIVGDDGSPTWTRVRPLDQALAEDTKSQ